MQPQLPRSVEPISLVKVNALIDQAARAEAVAWLLKSMFGGDRPSALVFFQRLLSKTTVIYEHHRDFVAATTRELLEVFSPDEGVCIYMARVRRLMDGEEAVVTAPSSSSARSDTGAETCFSMQFIDGRGLTPGPVYLHASFAIRVVSRILASEFLHSKLTNLTQLPYAFVEATVLTQSVAVKNFVLDRLVSPAYRDNEHVRRQLEYGNLACHFYSMEMFSMQLERLPLSLRIPNPSEAPAIDEEMRRVELCNSLDTSRLIVASHEYFLYRVSDLLYVHPTLPEWGPERLSACFFSVLMGMLHGLRLDDSAHILPYLTASLGSVMTVVAVHSELFERTRQVAREIARFLIVECAKAHRSAPPPDDVPAGWDIGYKAPTSKTIVSSEVFTGSGARIIEHSRPSQTVLGLLYRQSIRLTAQLQNYETALYSEIDSSFSWRWSTPTLMPVRLVVSELCNSLHFIQAERLAAAALSDKFFWAQSPPVVLRFPPGVQVGSICATMNHVIARYPRLCVKPIEAQDRAMLMARAQGLRLPSALTERIDSGEVNFYDIFFDHRTAYLLLSQRLLEVVRKLSLVEWLSARRDSNKPTSVTPILLRQYASAPVENYEPSASSEARKTDRYYLSLYTVVRILCTWLPIDTVSRDNRTVASPYVLEPEHPLFGCYRWLHRLLGHLSDVCTPERLHAVVASFLSIKRRHYIPFSLLARLVTHFQSLYAIEGIPPEKLAQMKEARESNKDAWVVIFAVSAIHSAAAANRGEDTHGTLVEFSLDASDASSLDCLAAYQDTEERILRMNYLFYRLLCGPWIPARLTQELLLAFSISPPGTPETQPRRIHRGLRDAYLMGNLDMVGIRAAEEPPAPAKTHPYKPYSYEIDADLRGEDLRHLGDYLMHLEWNTYRRDNQEKPTRRVNCPWHESFDTKRFLADPLLLNGDIPVALSPTSWDLETGDIATEFVYFDTGFLLKNARIHEDVMPLPPPQSIEEVEFSATAVQQQQRKRRRKRCSEEKAPFGQQFRGSWGERALRAMNATMPHSEVLDVLHRFEDVFRVDKIVLVYIEAKDPDYSYIYSDLARMGGLKPHMTDEERRRMIEFHKETSLYKAIGVFTKRMNYDYHIENSRALSGGLVFDEYGSFQ